MNEIIPYAFPVSLMNVIRRFLCMNPTVACFEYTVLTLTMSNTTTFTCPRNTIYVYKTSQQVCCLDAVSSTLLPALSPEGHHGNFRTIGRDGRAGIA